MHQDSLHTRYPNGRSAGLALDRCSICVSKLRGEGYYLEEEPDVEAPRQCWMLCAGCQTLVQDQMNRVMLQTPMRTRVAVGMVAAECAPTADAEILDQEDSRGLDRLVFWTAIVAFVVHALAFVVIVAFLVMV